MVSPVRAWRLEQNDRQIVFASSAGVSVFGQTDPFPVTRHRHPAWKVVLPLGGGVLVRQGQSRTTTASGVIVPPQLAHICTTTSAFVALFVDAWLLPPALGPARLDTATVARLLAALNYTDTGSELTDLDLGAALAEVMRCIGGAPPVEPRVAHALQATAHATSIGSIAGDVGLSPPRLRALVRASIGIPLARLRLWARLGAAVAVLPQCSVAQAAAAAGFADQPHLARTARELIGRTISSLRPTT
jgi:AraC-like DNA-binding protein